MYMLRMLSEINLILQVVILVVLFAGIFQAKRKRFNHHGYLMFFVVVLNFLSILLVMGPSAARILIGASPSTFTFLVAIHSLIGVRLRGVRRLHSPDLAYPENWRLMLQVEELYEGFDLFVDSINYHGRHNLPIALNPWCGQMVY